MVDFFNEEKGLRVGEFLQRRKWEEGAYPHHSMPNRSLQMSWLVMLLNEREEEKKTTLFYSTKDFISRTNVDECFHLKRG